MINKKRVKQNKAEQATAKQSPKRVSRKTLRRRRMIKRIISMVMVLMVTIGAIVAAMELLFVVHTVDVIGSDIFTDKEILDFVAIPPEENIFKVDAESIAADLTAEFTYIDNAQIIKRLPDRIEIKLEDSREEYYTFADNNYTIYSQSFKQLRNSSEPPLEAIWLDIETDNETKLALTKQLIELFSKYEFGDVTKITVTDESNISICFEDRIDINFGTILDIDYKIKMCKKILEEKIPAGEKGIIDATEGGEVVYKRQ